MNNKKNKKLFTILLLCAASVIIVFSIISLRTYSVETEGMDNGVDIDVDDVNISGTTHDNVSSKAILNKPQSADNYGNRNLSQVQNTSNTFINCNTNECKIKKIPDTRTQAYSNNLCWAYGASNAIESTLMNYKRDTEYNTYNIGSQNDTMPRFSPTHMGYALGKTFANNNANEYGYMNLTDGGFALDSIIYLTNGIGPILAPNKGSNNPFSVELYEHGKDYFTIPERQTIINNLNYPINYKVSEIQMISGINAETLTDNAITYPENSLVQDRINTIKTYLQEGYGITIESRSISTSDDGKCDCSRADTRSTYCDNGPHHNTNKTCFYHVMLLVGWDDDYAVSNFVSGKEPPAKGAWIARNSLNETNLVHISYYDYRSLTSDILAITNIAKINNTYDKLYQYNPSGCDTWGYTNKWDEQSYICKDFNRISTQKIANVYDRENNPNKEQLTEVSFFVNKPTTISVYYKEGSTVDDELFNNSNLIGTKEISSKGYYTVPISGIKINNNNYVIGLSSSESGEVFAFQGKSNSEILNPANVGIAEGISYYKDGNTWKDEYTNNIKTTNFIKAYTKNTTEPVEDEPNQPEPEQVTYIVKYYQETLTDNQYEEIETVNKTGALGDTITVNPEKNYTGFTKPASQEVTLTNNTEVSFNYNRNTHTVTLTKGTGIADVTESGTYKYGATVTINATVANGYTWSNWTDTNTGDIISANREYTISQMPDYDINYTANAIANSPSTIPVTGISLELNHFDLLVDGAPLNLKATIMPPNASNKNVIWTSSNPEVASVEGNTSFDNGNYQYGIVRGLSEGETTITVTTEDGNYHAECVITVIKEEIEVETIELNKTSITIKENMSETLEATIKPDDADDKTIVWTSSNPSVATVSNGVVRGVKAGTATITATTGNGKTATCSVTVETNVDPVVHVTKVTVSPKSRTMYVGSSYKLAYTVKPATATDKNVTWTSSNTSVATVDANGMVKGLKAGTTTITVKSVDGNKKAEATIKVVAKPSTSSQEDSSKPTTEPLQPKVTITLSDKKISLLEGKEYKLTSKVTGSNAIVTWESSDPSIATVENGKVTGVSLGRAIIRAKVNGTNISDTCEVTVIKEEEIGVKFPAEETIVYLDQIKSISLIISPTDMEIEKTEYIIEDEEIIVIEEGNIKGLKIGSTKLKVKVNDKYTAETIVIVKEEPMTLTISGYELNFNEETNSYTLEIKKEKSLEITSNKDIEITGNENLKNKSVIKVTNKETEKEYTILIKKKNNMTYIFLGITVLMAAICALVFIKKKRS